MKKFILLPTEFYSGFEALLGMETPQHLDMHWIIDAATMERAIEDAEQALFKYLQGMAHGEVVKKLRRDGEVRIITGKPPVRLVHGVKYKISEI